MTAPLGAIIPGQLLRYGCEEISYPRPLWRIHLVSGGVVLTPKTKSHCGDPEFLVSREVPGIMQPPVLSPPRHQKSPSIVLQNPNLPPKVVNDKSRASGFRKPVFPVVTFARGERSPCFSDCFQPYFRFFDNSYLDRHFFAQSPVYAPVPTAGSPGSVMRLDEALF